MGRPAFLCRSGFNPTLLRHGVDNVGLKPDLPGGAEAHLPLVERQYRFFAPAVRTPWNNAMAHLHDNGYKFLFSHADLVRELLEFQLSIDRGMPHGKSHMYWSQGLKKLLAVPDLSDVSILSRPHPPTANPPTE